MSDGSPAGTRKRLAAGVVSVAALGFVLYLSLAPRVAPPVGQPPAPPEPVPAAEAPAVADPGPQAEVAAAPAIPDAAPAQGVAAGPEDAAAPAVPDAAPAQGVAAGPEDAAAPGFDLVRVAPDGAAVVAGRAAPGSLVTVYADDAPLAEAEADADGNFVAIFKATPSEVPQALTLGAVLPGGEEVASEDVVVLLPEAPDAPAEVAAGPAAPGGGAPAIAVPGPVAAAPAVPPTPASEPAVEVASDPVQIAPSAEAEAALPEVVAEVVAAPAVEVAAPAPAVEVAVPAAEPVEPATEVAAAEPAGPPTEAAAVEPAAAGAETRPLARVAATAILRGDGLEVVSNEPPRPRQVSLASISYADGGQVTLAGLGTAGARLRAYVDDGFSQEATVGVDGRWSLELGEVEQGIYQLRIDQIGPAGQVASRVETPFQRDLPRPPLQRPAAGDRPVQVTVQPGANLWTLARVHYGAGVLYTQIFTANSDLIRDPDLIYPGQIFDLPGVEADN